MAKFPSNEWPQALMEKLNSDDHYANVARNWEGDMLFVIEGLGENSGEVHYYFDLWHGKCRDAYPLDELGNLKPTFTLRGSYANYVRLLNGELDPLQALFTRKIGVQGNMAMLMRSVPTVLDFVRCCREMTDSFL